MTTQATDPTAAWARAASHNVTSEDKHPAADMVQSCITSSTLTKPADRQNTGDILLQSLQTSEPCGNCPAQVASKGTGQRAAGILELVNSNLATSQKVLWSLKIANSKPCERHHRQREGGDSLMCTADKGKSVTA